MKYYQLFLQSKSLEMKMFICYRKKSICGVKVWDVGFTSSVSATKTQMWLILETSCQ